MVAVTAPQLASSIEKDLHQEMTKYHDHHVIFCESFSEMSSQWGWELVSLVLLLILLVINHQ